MKYNCEVVQDLLPLYVDNICSMQSREIVDAHIEECPRCKEQLTALGDRSVTQELSQERDGVLKTHMKKEKKRSTMIAMITSACLTVPIIVCLICNLAVGHALDWFFIVLTSLLVFASVTIVPLVTCDNKLLWTLGSFTVSVLALLGTICIYTNGNWFYIVAVPVTAGLLICFMPYIIRHLPLPAFLRNHKALLVMLVDTAAVYSIIAAAGLYTRYPGYWDIAVPIASFCMILPWAIVLTARYIPISKMYRGAVISLICGVFCAFINDVAELTLGEFDKLNLLKADFSNWNYYTNNGNIAWLFIISGTVIALILAVAGRILSKTKRN